MNLLKRHCFQWQFFPSWWPLVTFRRYAETDDSSTWCDNWLTIGPFQCRWYS